MSMTAWWPGILSEVMLQFRIITKFCERFLLGFIGNYGKYIFFFICLSWM